MRVGGVAGGHPGAVTSSPNKSSPKKSSPKTSSPQRATTVYTDGACLGNPGPGGWAWAVPDGPYASGPAAKTTNQRMEITAAYEALRALDGPVDVVSDSTYVVHCFRDGWWEGWMKRGWKNSKKEPVANRDLWEPLIELVRSRPDVSFRWVKGHSGDPMNDAVDALATDAARTQAAREGEHLSAVLIAQLEEDPADRSATATPSVAGEPDGDGIDSLEGRLETHGVVVTGHRPPELGGYDANRIADGVRRRLVEILRAKAQVDTELVVATGLGLGAEQLGAEAAAEADIPYVAVLAFPDPDSVWPDASRRHFRKLLDGAEQVIVHTKKPPRSKQQAGAAIARRDAWLAAHNHEAVVVWDGTDRAVGKTVRTLEESLDDVWIVEPW